MAQMRFDPPNFLVLDEPTNHLDLLTKEMLIGALSQYEGAMLFVSRDRNVLAALSKPRSGVDAGRRTSIRWRLSRIRRPNGSQSARLARVALSSVGDKAAKPGRKERTRYA